MKVNERVITGYRQETRVRYIPAQFDEDGIQLIGERMENYTVDIPITEEVVREMTEEEIAAMEADSFEVEAVPTIEETVAMHSAELERQAGDIDVLSATTDDMILLMADIIGSV